MLFVRHSFYVLPKRILTTFKIVPTNRAAYAGCSKERNCKTTRLDDPNKYTKEKQAVLAIEMSLRPWSVGCEK